MKNITLFFCDICGTLTKDINFKINEEALSDFIENLNLLIKQGQTDGIILSLVTTEKLEITNLVEKQINEYVKENRIILGPHIYNSVNKPCDIVDYIEKINSTYHIDKIYYADDCELYHYFLEELVSDYDYNIQSIIPKDNSLFDVNKNLLNYSQKVKKKKSVSN